MPGQFGFELSPEDIAAASDKTQQQVSPSFSSLADELAPVPWWKRRMRQMQNQTPSMPQQGSQAPSGSTAVDSWTNLGKGVNNIAMKLFGMADGGAVQGPTMAMIGEGGEPEYVVPQSKVAPWIAATMRDGAPPNPADLPRGEHRPPPPVILGNSPAMACGGKVVPAMANGGMVDPFLNMDPFAVPDFSAAPPAMQMPQVSQPPVAGITPPRGQQAGQVAPPMLGSPDAMKRLADLQRNRPMPKWYERPFMGNGAQLDMRPGVAGYSQAGRAVGNVIGALLPINRKAGEWERNVEAAKVDAAAEQAKDAAATKQAEMDRAGKVADSTVARNEATRAKEQRLLEKANEPPPVEDPYKGMIEVTPEFGAKAGIVPGKDGKYHLPAGAVRIPAEQRPANPTAATLAATAADPNATPEQRAAAEKALRLLKPPKVAGAAKADPMDELLPVSEAKALNVPYGTTRRQAVGKSATAAPKLSAKEKDDLQTLSVLDNAISKLLGDQKSLKAGVGKWDGTVGSWWDRTVGTGADGRVMTARQLLGVVTGALAKAQGGASFTPTERELMERYTPVQTESDESVISKLEGLRDNFLSTKRQAIESLNNAADDSPQPTSSGASATIVQRNKKTGAVRHSLDGGKTWINGEPK